MPRILSFVALGSVLSFACSGSTGIDRFPAKDGGSTSSATDASSTSAVIPDGGPASSDASATDPTQEAAKMILGAWVSADCLGAIPGEVSCLFEWEFYPPDGASPGKWTTRQRYTLEDGCVFTYYRRDGSYRILPGGILKTSNGDETNEHTQCPNPDSNFSEKPAKPTKSYEYPYVLTNRSLNVSWPDGSPTLHFVRKLEH